MSKGWVIFLIIAALFAYGKWSNYQEEQKQEKQKIELRNEFKNDMEQLNRDFESGISPEERERREQEQEQELQDKTLDERKDWLNR